MCTVKPRSAAACSNSSTAEQWIKEGKQATHWTRLSCHRFRANEVRLQLNVPAYNLGNLWRRLGLPNRIKSWSLTSLQHRLMKTGGRLVKHARYYWLLLAKGHLNRRLCRCPFLPSAALNARPFCLGNMGELSPCSVNAVGWFPSGKSSLI